ncbi:medulloblastoma antigen MU-MB-50.4, putative [Pediculus humanus corporis]|uniref:Medulloblastoma antigen MU-MB-50.4, putative n=1 Tax=Pediculus humanus subsp. corporis TaxID=121224 RepID=E0VNJ7_PEDHC|nr:medulloblastoma antigen MU-MB-50.4, putative [Pediculus humanus corporis]EEB14953.1 medulloblastoma antigen MU-MB-50.4, putative [Pediculus humanus corporis]
MDRCPGLYCGRTLLENGSYSECGACPRGYRTNTSICVPCSDHPEFYDWLYLAFMVLVALVLHWFAIDFLALKRRLGLTKQVLIIHFSALVEVSIAAVATILVVEPTGSFQITSCKTRYLSDWYSLFHNPSPNYEETLHCTQEAIYPLYTMVFIFYAIATVVMILIRPKYCPHGKMSVYAGLYFYPILAFFQAVFGGIIYYAFPYIVIIISLISSATHFAQKKDQAIISLIVDTLVNVRNVVVLIGHWLFHAYGIIAVTELKETKFHWAMLALVPLPTVFYILTSRFTDPSKL